MACLCRILISLWLALGLTAARAEGGVPVVAAENVYRDVAQQIGGNAVAATSLINNPAQDPHLFEVSPAAARALADAQIAVANGADYDSWFTKLLASAPRPARIQIVVADLVGRKAGDNPHLWYDPSAMPAFAKAFAAAVAKIDPSHEADYETRLAAFLASLQPIEAKVAAMRDKYNGQPVTATEPVFGPMTDAIGLTNRNQRFQLAMMNDTEPTAHDLAEFERDLKQRRVRVLLNNVQVSGPIPQRLVALAQASNVPVVGVTENLPPGEHYQDWLMRELDALDRALGGSR